MASWSSASIPICFAHGGSCPRPRSKNSMRSAPLSRRFASKDVQRFEGVGFTRGESGVALLDGVLGWLECRVTQTYAGGDHMIVVGRVESLSIARPDEPPLLFYAGRYRTLGEAL